MKRYALVIGINAYPGNNRLNYACADAENVSSALRNDFDEICLLKDFEATASSIFEKIEHFKEKLRREESIFVFYFSGHGAELDDNPYINAIDQCIRIADIRRETNILDVQRLFVFDCCRASLEQQYRYNSLPTIISETFPGIIPPIILSGCSSGQYAWEAAEGGIFTKALLDELPKANSFEDFIEYLRKKSINSQDFNISIQGIYDFLLLKKWIPKYYQCKKYVYPEEPEVYESFYKNWQNADARKALRKAADSGNGGALRYLGLALWQDFKSSRSKEKSINAQECFKKASELGDSFSMFSLAMIYGIEHKSSEAFEFYLKAAENGVELAQYRVGLCYCSGNGVERNERLGFYWLNKAAENGVPDAIQQVAECYEHGYGCEKDHAKAQAYLWTSAKKCNLQAIKKMWNWEYKSVKRTAAKQYSMLHDAIKETMEIVKFKE